MRPIDDIRAELDEAIERRAQLWEELSEQHDPGKSAEASRLSARIDELWAESRNARVRSIFGPSERIVSRARAEERLEREARRLRNAA